jgi:hypothetical protein
LIANRKSNAKNTKGHSDFTRGPGDVALTVHGGKPSKQQFGTTNADKYGWARDPGDATYVIFDCETSPALLVAKLFEFRRVDDDPPGTSVRPTASYWFLIALEPGRAFPEPCRIVAAQGVLQGGATLRRGVSIAEDICE